VSSPIPRVPSYLFWVRHAWVCGEVTLTGSHPCPTGIYESKYGEPRLQHKYARICTLYDDYLVLWLPMGREASHLGWRFTGVSRSGNQPYSFPSRGRGIRSPPLRRSGAVVQRPVLKVIMRPPQASPRPAEKAEVVSRLPTR
jgi:hypothetical protein